MKDARKSRRWKRLRAAVLWRDRYRCHWCGDPANEVDHVVALAHGGLMFDPHNLVASCVTCNRRRAGLMRARRVQVTVPRDLKLARVQPSGGVRRVWS